MKSTTSLLSKLGDGWVDGFSAGGELPTVSSPLASACLPVCLPACASVQALLDFHTLSDIVCCQRDLDYKDMTIFQYITYWNVILCFFLCVWCGGAMINWWVDQDSQWAQNCFDNLFIILVFWFFTKNLTKWRNVWLMFWENKQFSGHRLNLAISQWLLPPLNRLFLHKHSLPRVLLLWLQRRLDSNSRWTKMETADHQDTEWLTELTAAWSHPSREKIIK